MQNESAGRAEELRTAVRFERAKVGQIAARITDKGVKELLQRARVTLDDVEQFFLGALEREKRPAHAEAMWLGHAEVVLSIAVRQRQAVESLVAKFGPNLMSIPS